VRWTQLTERQIPFERLEQLQSELVQRLRSSADEGFLLVSEPTPTFTRGRFADDSDVLWTATDREAHGVAVHPVSRGGKWTYHGPGQILVYPVVDLKSLGYSRRAVYEFVTRLREGIARPLRDAGLPIEEGSRPFGLFARGKKLASFGIAVEKGIVSHGVALYWSDQSKYFQGIHPCGVADQSTISLTELGWETSWIDTAELLARSIEKSLNH